MKKQKVDAEAVLGMTRGEGPKADGPINLTELGNARRVVEAHGTDVRYCNQIPSRWIYWDGTRWAQDEKGHVTRLAKRVPEWLQAVAAEKELEAKRVLEEGAEGSDRRAEALTKKAKAMRRWADKSESNSSITSTMSLLKTERLIPIHIDEVDKHPWLLGTPSMTVNLRDRTYHSPRREDYLTKQTGVPFDPKAKAPRWERFISEIMKDDEEMVGFIQRSVGYTLIGKQVEHVMFVCHGDGDNGKSLFLKAIRRMMGDYSATVPADSFVGRKDGSIPNDIAMLAGARFVSFSESKENALLDEGLVKQVTGGDPISARFLNREFFEFEPQFTMWMATNHRPRVRGGDHGIWRRLRLVPFERKFAPEEQDRELDEKLALEGSGILNWALDGLRMWQERGIDPPARVVDATDQYRKDQNVVMEFIEQCCTVGEHDAVTATDLYTRFSEWSKSAGEMQRSQRWFGVELGKLGYERGKSSHQRVYHGISITGAPPKVLSWRDRTHS